MTSPAPPPSRPVPLEGRIRVRVRYSECDPMGVAHHAAYAPWLEIGRTELLRESGVAYRDLEAAGVLLAVTRLEMRYHASARSEDLLEVFTRVVGGGRARIDHEYHVFRVDESQDSTGPLLATAASTLACLDTAGRPRALPEWLAPPSVRSARPRR